MHKMPRKKLLTQDAIPTTSLADMMFLLLIFFIITTTLTRVTGIVTDMPAGSKTQQAQAEKNITVGLHNGQFTVDDKPMTVDEVERYLKGLHLQQRSDDGRFQSQYAGGGERGQDEGEPQADGDILIDGAAAQAAQAYAGSQAPQIVGHERKIGRRHGHICALRAHGHPDGAGPQRQRIVDAIADHHGPIA